MSMPHSVAYVTIFTIIKDKSMTFRKILLLSAIALLSLNSCFVINTKASKTFVQKEPAHHMSPTLGGKLFTSAWIQRSAEYQALCQQSYVLARLRLDEALKQTQSKPVAIVTDIDETILDNSPNAVHQALKGEDYTDQSWDEWCDRAEAVPMAGALEFFRYADERGVKIYYISNRNERNRIGTIKNLSNLGFPQVVNEQLLLRQKTSDKTERRTQVSQRYNIVLLLGDNLGDFEHIFDSDSETERLQGLSHWRQEFGKRFIVLPNPNYGTWEKAMNGGYPPLIEKDHKLKTILKSY